MALTMTRTRTQTALTKLAQLVAEVHGELAFVARLAQEFPEYAEGFRLRMGELMQKRDGLYLTLKQFDPEIDPKAIGESAEWMRRYGRRNLARMPSRYLAALYISSDCSVTQ